ncbi:MAG: nitroreductase family protein, partial [Candidatus Kapabacteria bacterium]|nr:nitroreductase family protein [Candidatus Kapabacteria bacterium]
GQTVPQDKVDTILESIRMAPTSFGLQLLKVFVISDKEVLNKISEAACVQPQIKECSHLLVFTAREELTDAEIDAYLQKFIDVRGMTKESLQGFKEMMAGMQKIPKSDFVAWSKHQTYITLGIALAAAALEEVDATPMEGFNNALLDEILNLKSQGLTSTLLMPIGYRDLKNDYLAGAPKIRKSNDELFEMI